MPRLSSITLVLLLFGAMSGLQAKGQRPPGVGGGPPGVSCSVAATTHVNFGAYHPLSPTALDTMGSVSLRCTGGGALPMIVVQLGRGAGGAFLPRAMLRGSQRLEYNLFLDAGRTVVWGDGTNGTSLYSTQAARGRSLVVPIYARVPPRQRIPPGRYGDSIVMTLLY